jgi:hypothetical protein
VIHGDAVDRSQQVAADQAAPRPDERPVDREAVPGVAAGDPFDREARMGPRVNRASVSILRLAG